MATVKITGLREVVSDLLHCPVGFHYEVWSDASDDGIEIWTSDLMSQNTWTINHAEGERELTGTIHEIRERSEWEGSRVSMTEAVRRAVEEVWGVSTVGATSATGVKRVRKTGGSLVIAISDLAEVVGVDIGDAVKVTISPAE